jgi:hypothetical protein
MQRSSFAQTQGLKKSASSLRIGGGKAMNEAVAANHAEQTCVKKIHSQSVHDGVRVQLARVNGTRESFM